MKWAISLFLVMICLTSFNEVPTNRASRYIKHPIIEIEYKDIREIRNDTLFFNYSDNEKTFLLYTVQSLINSEFKLKTNQCIILKQSINYNSL